MQQSVGFIGQSLSRRLVFYLLLLLLASGAAVLTLGSFLLAGNADRELQRKMEEYQEFFPWILAPALWDMNDGAVSTVSRVFSQNEFITLLNVRNTFGNEIYFFQREGEVSFTLKEIEIKYEGKVVGTMTLGLGKSYFEKISQDLFLTFSLVFLLFGGIMILGSGLVIQQVIAQPFESLGRMVHEYEPGKPGVFEEGVRYKETAPLVERLRAMGETITLQMKEIQDSEVKFRTLMETSPVAMAVSDPRGRIEKLNKAFVDLMGYQLEDIPDINAWSILAYPDPAQRQILYQDWEARIRESVLQGQPFRPMEVSVRAKDGTGRFLEIRHVVMGIFSLTTFQDLTERKKNEQELQKALSELESKNSEMERYLYTVSHDLKSPLVTIKGYAGYLEKALESTGMEGPLKDLGRIQKAADRASLLLEDLLHLSRVGRGHSVLSAVDTAELVREVVEAFAPELEKAGAECTVTGSWPEVLGEKARLGEVWQNLLENALKYRSPDRSPKLHLECKKLKDYWQFSLQDNGQGIEQPYLHKIFDIFEKIDPKSEGSGIGLAIVRRIVEYHGGQIWAQSAGLGEGVTVYFTIPVRS